VLRPFLFRRLKTDVADQLPDKKEVTILCAMSAWQHSMYLTMADHSVYVGPGMKLTRVDNKVMQCRKICNHPYLFQEHYYIDALLIRTCGKFELLDRILPKLYRTGHRVLIFSQMTELLDLLQDLLGYLQFRYLRLDGGTKAELRPQLVADFNAERSEYFAFLLSTRAGGLGLNLQTADTVILYDNDWNPFADQQASARVHRIGQDKEVLVLNLSTPDTVERKVLKVQNEKRAVEDMIIGVAIFNDEANDDDRRAVYQAVTAKNQTGGVARVPGDEQINKMLARTSAELEVFEEMDLERDARYQREWEIAGHAGDYPRLVTYEELPDYLKVSAEELKREEDLPDVRKSRSKNQLSLIDNITDSEYTRMIEDGKDPGEHLSEIAALRRSIRSVVEEVRGLLGTTFDALPSREELPEYYEIVKNPITFKEIKRKAKSGEYVGVGDLCTDLALMARNATRFNPPGSVWYVNAKQVLGVCDRIIGKRTELPGDASSFG
jgi:superfamily II DNA/RNA helicase